MIGRCGRDEAAFTVVELLVVMSIILVLAGLILATSSYVHNKGARSRAEAEIAAMSAALENYKADNGVYPSGKSTAAPASGTPTYTVAQTGTGDLNAVSNSDSTLKIYQDASRYLYEHLTGDANLDLATDNGATSYISLKENQLAVIKDPNGKTVGLSHIKDPFGNSYGYSTKYQADVAAGITPPGGYNPTFDLWSTSGATAATDRPKWIKNW